MRIERNVSLPLKNSRHGRKELYTLVTAALNDASVGEWIAIHELDHKTFASLAAYLRQPVNADFQQRFGLCVKVKQSKQEDGSLSLYVSKQSGV